MTALKKAMTTAVVKFVDNCRILSKIKNVFGIEGASIALHDAKKREFFFIRTAEEQRDGNGKRMDRMRFPDDYGVAGRVLREKQSVMIDDVSNDERFSSDLDIQKDFVTRSMICVPLKTRKDILGVLYALNKLSGEFSQKVLFLLEILSSTIAIAIEQMERQMVAHALEAAKGNRSQAARDLGLTRQGLLNKINRYKISK